MGISCCKELGFKIDSQIENNNISNIEKKSSTNQPISRNNYNYLKNINNDLINEAVERKIALGTYLDISEYKKIINEQILNYIKTHRLNYQEYFPSTINTYKSNPIKCPNGNIYYGNWNSEGEMEGYGIYFIKDKNITTEGVWKKGNIIYGRIFFPNYDIYEGYMKNSSPHGKGTITFMNKEIYKGDFVNGEMTGKGTFIFKDKSSYSGSIKEGIFNGEGSMKWIDGTEYHGNFLDSTLNGKGKIFNDNLKEKYDGNFYKNEFDGYGIYYYKNGDIYVGNFENGLKEGKGKYKRNDNVEFDANWDNDLLNGKGIITFNTDKLEGFWRNGNIIRKEIIKGTIDVFRELDLNLKPIKRSLNPSSLQYLNNYDNKISQFTVGTEYTTK